MIQLLDILAGTGGEDDNFELASKEFEERG